MSCEHINIIKYESKEIWGDIYYFGLCINCKTTLLRTFPNYDLTNFKVKININGHENIYPVFSKV